MANDHKADVWVEKDGTKVNGKSIMGLLMLACPLGSSIMVKTEGVDETEAFEELKNLVEGGFGER
jgi:phosphocarrier protein